MRVLLLALLIASSTAAAADEIPYEFTGLWAETKSECSASPGDTYNTFIGRNRLEQYETACSLIDIKTDGVGRSANMRCNIGGVKYTGSVQIAPTPTGKLIVDLRSKYFNEGRLTLSLVFCNRNTR